MTEQLRRCPFCGSEMILHRENYVECDNCGSAGPLSLNPEENEIFLWNTRTVPAQLEREWIPISGATFKAGRRYMLLDVTGKIWIARSTFDGKCKFKKDHKAGGGVSHYLWAYDITHISLIEDE